MTSPALKLTSFIAIITLTSITGCANLQTQQLSLDASIIESQYVHEHQGPWQLLAKLSYRSTNEFVTGQMSWRQEESGTYELSIFSSGVGGGEQLRLRKEATRYFINNEIVGTAADVIRLVEEQTGFVVPLAELEHWLVGNPDTSSQFSATYGLDDSTNDSEDFGAILSMEQRDWQIKYDRFSSGLAYRIRLDNPPQSIRIVITDWQAL